MKELVKNISQPEPYVLMFRDQFFLVIDCIVVTEVDAETVPITLLSSYFVFNIRYPKGCSNLLSIVKYVCALTCRLVDVPFNINLTM